MSNKEVVSLKDVVKSDSSVEQRVYFVRELQRRNRASIKGRLFEANLGNDREFISKEYIFIGTRPFGEAQSKAMRAYAQSGQYHTIVEIRDS